MSESRMFKSVATWNPVVGCRHDCVYCWARRQAKRMMHRCAECYTFTPHIHSERLKLKLHGRTIFVVSMGDLFGDWVPDEWILSVLRACRESDPSNTFLFLTKNPDRYLDFIEDFPYRSILGVTIETNRSTAEFSKAPEPCVRFEAMMDIPAGFDKAVCVEPVMDFDIGIFIGMIEDIDPCMVWIGYDNYGHRLPEPSLAKTRLLIDCLRKQFNVEEKTVRKAWWEVV